MKPNEIAVNEEARAGMPAQSHAFHLAFTAVIGLAAYQAVIALARNSEGFDFWGGVLMCGANATLLIPMLAVPMIFGGLRSRRLRDLSPPQVRPGLPPAQPLVPVLIHFRRAPTPVRVSRVLHSRTGTKFCIPRANRGGP